MTGHEPYELVLTPPALRAIGTTLTESVAAAVNELMAGALIDNSRRVGKPLHGDLARIRSARRGTYRVLYRINEPQHEVVIVRIEHRQDVCRSR